jgi:hypothetical protein
MQDYVMFSGCSPYILPDLNNPFVVCDNFYKLDKDVLSERQAIGNKFNELSVINRSWVLTPKTFSSSTNDCNLIPFVKVQGEVNTHETLWAWSLKSDKALILSDDTLPAHAGTFIKIRMKVKAKNINEKLSYQFTGSGGTAFVEKDISTSWDVVEIITGIPSVWQSENRKPYGSIGLSVKGNMFLAGVTIEELHDYTSTLPTPSYNYIGKTFYKINADGVADDYVVCVKNADNTYAWKTLLA